MNEESEEMASILLRDDQYASVMKALVDDEVHVRRELTFFVTNVAMHAPARLATRVAEEKRMIEYMKYIFE